MNGEQVSMKKETGVLYLNLAFVYSCEANETVGQPR
jgi:hypothetical protein